MLRSTLRRIPCSRLVLVNVRVYRAQPHIKRWQSSLAGKQEWHEQDMTPIANKPLNGKGRRKYVSMHLF